MVSIKITDKRLEELSVLMTVRKPIIRLLAETLKAASDQKSSSSHCSLYGSVPTGGVMWQRSAVYLGHCDGTLLCQLFFSLLAGVRVTEVRVEVLIQDLCCLLVEVSSFPSARRASN